MPPDLSVEAAAAARLGSDAIAGVDEAGRGPLAGPVVAAAVVVRAADVPALDGLTDSKKLSAARREALYSVITAGLPFGIGEASVAEIERHNILRATFLAMSRALAAVEAGLGAPPALALIDGNRAPRLTCAAQTVVGGDGRCLSIAAASVVAKVHRDRIMARLASEHPGYGWERNAGYGTAEHRDALRRLGLTPHHRRGFAPVAEILRQLEGKTQDMGSGVLL